MTQNLKSNSAQFAAKTKIVTKPRAKRIKAEAAPFVSMKEMRDFASSQVKHHLTDLQRVKKT